jgi:subtilase family serine protease
LVVAGSAAGVTPAVALADDHPLIPGSHPSWAVPQAKVADARPGTTLTFRVYLKSRDADGVEAAARAVSDPGSAQFREYLSADQVRARFAPDNASVDAVKGWLTTAGLAVGAVPQNNLYVEASGTVEKVQRAFGVSLSSYRVRDSQLRAPDHELSVPAAVASKVSGVVGVDQSEKLLGPKHVGAGDEIDSVNANRVLAKPAIAPPPAGFRNAQPCSAYWGEKADTTDPAYDGKRLPYAPCGYEPAQLRSASGIDDVVGSGVDGRGVTVAIVDAFASPTIYEDASAYAKRNDPKHPLRRNQFRQIVFPETDPDQENLCDASGWYGEETLDVEAVHAMAPGADILYVGGSDCQDASLDKALNEVVSKNLAQIVSNSYGSQGEAVTPDVVNAFQTIAVQAVLQGIGVYFSSGDSGDEAANVGRPEADFSASSPWVTAVGGTSLGIGEDGGKVVETGWETGKSTLTNGAWTPPAPGAYLYGAGGGTSRLFRQPFYQRGIVPDALARQNQTGNDRGRVVPDISMVGDPNTGMLIGVTQTFPDGAHYSEYRIGGTSLSSPLLAGLMAVSDQYTHVRHGFINPWLYQVTSHTSAVTDVKHATGGDVRVDYANGLDASGGFVRTVRSFDHPGLTIHTTGGYDNVTGLGTPNGERFLALS